jgi:5-azacytidine-induced protein 1
MEQKESADARTIACLKSELEMATKQEANAVAALEELRRQKNREVGHIEERVRATVQRKDDMIAALRQQLAEAQESIRSTEQLLA